MNNAFPLQENSKTDCEKCNLSLVTPKWNHLAKKFDLKSLKALSPKVWNCYLTASIKSSENRSIFKNVQIKSSRLGLFRLRKCLSHI